MKISTIESLAATGCDNPGCPSHHDEIFLHPKCHEGEGLDAFFDKRDQTLKIICHVCE